MKGVNKARGRGKSKVSYPLRGEIYQVKFDPTVGSEIRKTRAALVIQNDTGNQHSPITIIAAITSKVSALPFPVEVLIAPTKENGLSAPSAIHLNQIRSVERQRLVMRLGSADAATMTKVDQAISRRIQSMWRW